MSRKKPPDEPGQDVESAAIACLVISDVLLDIADRAFERKRDGAEAAEFAAWLAECYEEMATGACRAANSKAWPCRSCSAANPPPRRSHGSPSNSITKPPTCVGVR